MIRPRSIDVVVGLVVALAAGGATGSFLLHPTDLHLPRCSEPFDAAIYPWNFYWFEHALRTPEASLLSTQDLFSPARESLTLYTPTYGYGLLALPLRLLVDAPQARFAAVALFLCTSSLFTAVLCYALGRRLGLQPPGAALAALAFTLGAGRLMNAARLNLFGTEFLLLWLYAGVLLWQRPGWRRALGFGLCGGILLWQSQPLFYQGALAVTFGAAAAVVRAARRGEPRAVRRLAGALLAAVLAFLPLGAPFLWEMAHALRESPGFAQADAMLAVPDSSLDLAALVLPNAADRWYGSFLGLRRVTFFEGQAPGASVSFFLGFSWWLLAGAALFLQPWRRWLGPLLFSLAAFALALGPVVRLLDHPLPLLAPYRLLQWFPPVGLDKSPVRLVLLVQLGLAFLAALGGDALWQRLHPRGVARGAGLLLAAVLVAEQAETLPLRSLEPRARVPERIAAIADEPGSFTVLDLLLDGEPFPAHRVNAVSQALAAAHERPIFHALFPRASRESFRDTLEPTALVQDLRALGHAVQAGESPERPPASGAREDLARLGVRYVVVHQPADGPPWSAPLAAAYATYLEALGPKTRTRLEISETYRLVLFEF